MKGHALTRHVLEPALEAAGRVLPRNFDKSIDNFEANNGIIEQGYDGILTAPPEQKPKPFEVVFETPHHAPKGRTGGGAYHGHSTILDRFKGLDLGGPEHLMARSRHILPGFNLTLGYTLLYLGIIVLIPLSALFLKTLTGGWAHFFQTITDPRAVASYYVSFGISLAAALVNGVFGVIAAWVLARYNFPGRKLLDAIVDLPFALPTAVAGIALTTIYARNGLIGELLLPYGIKRGLYPVGRFRRAHLHWAALCGSHGAAGDSGSRCRCRGGRRHAGSESLADFYPRYFPRSSSSILTGVMLALRACRR